MQTLCSLLKEHEQATGSTAFHKLLDIQGSLNERVESCMFPAPFVFYLLFLNSPLKYFIKESIGILQNETSTVTGGSTQMGGQWCYRKILKAVVSVIYAVKLTASECIALKPPPFLCPNSTCWPFGQSCARAHLSSVCYGQAHSCTDCRLVS